MINDFLIIPYCKLNFSVYMIVVFCQNVRSDSHMLGGKVWAILFIVCLRVHVSKLLSLFWIFI